MQIANGVLRLSPSDLNDYVECRQRILLAVEVAEGKRPRPRVFEESAELLRRKGEQHELAYLDALRAGHVDVAEIAMGDNWDFATAAARTLDAMRSGADVIWQGTFTDGAWRGRADFLLKVPGQSALGDWHYEAVDAKLSRTEKPSYLLQLCFYTEQLGRLQRASPERMHVLLGDGSRRSLRYEDFAAYYRRVRERFGAMLAVRAAFEPYPIAHCALCDFHGVCKARWEHEDHLSLVANLRRTHVTPLRARDLGTLEALGRAAPEMEVPPLAPSAFAALQDQASLQLKRRGTGVLDWHLLPNEARRGFALLPQPAPGDIVFDIEGDPFWDPARGLRFLFGFLVREGEGWRYTPLWAHDRTGEKRMFEQFIDLVWARRAADPRMHVYHYGSAEGAALKELMGLYATREDAIDELLRGRVFVDLHTVVRQGLRAGVSSYSLKEVEALAAYARRAEVKSGMHAVLAYERWMESGEAAELDRIAAYNEEDCRATLALRDWLVAQRPDARSWLGDGDAHESADPAKADAKRADAEAREALRQALLEDAEAGSARWLAAELLHYHQREARPAWWWFFERCDHMTTDELVDDTESIGRLSDTGVRRNDKQSTVYRMSFPVQQHKLAAGKAAVDPATGKRAGEIVLLDDAAGVVELKRGRSFATTPLPQSIIPEGPVETKAQKAALLRFAESMLRADDRYSALKALVARDVPRIEGREAGTPLQTTDLDALRELAAGLQGSYLFVQGPPGTGKTWTGSRLVTELIRRGRRVGVASTSHKAIHNLLDGVEEAAKQEGLDFRGLKKAGEDEETWYEGRFIQSSGENKLFDALPADVQLVAGTAWLFAREQLDSTLDVLVIDEAGQVSLADALAMGTCARNLILLGDPLQLAQVSQGTHPEGTGLSVLEHLLGDHATVPAERGIFLDRTRRMHPDVCRFISEIVYDRRLAGIQELERQSTSHGTGLRFIAVEHEGNTSSSNEEAAAVASSIATLSKGTWTDREGVTRPLVQRDFMVVAPYNAQVRKLRSALAIAGLPDVQVGTVDKFQGREAPIVFYSMASSGTEEVPRGLEFLFSRNRLNVAVSRARCLAYIVASPRLLESDARTIEQMRLVNALCRFVEIAGEQASKRPASGSGQSAASSAS